MINAMDLRNSYNKLYTEFRRYIWDFKIVEYLADLEIECYNTCPNIPEVRLAFMKLKQGVRDVLRDDEDLEKVFDSFDKLIQESDEAYVKLNQVNEVVQ